MAQADVRDVKDIQYQVLQRILNYQLDESWLKLFLEILHKRDIPQMRGVHCKHGFRTRECSSGFKFRLGDIAM